MGPKTLPTIWGAYMKLVTKYQISAINSCWEKCDEKCAYMFNVYRNQLSRQTGSRNLTCPKTLPTIWYTYMMLFTDLLSCNWHVKSCAIYMPNAYKVIKLTSSVPPARTSAISIRLRQAIVSLRLPWMFVKIFQKMMAAIWRPLLYPPQQSCRGVYWFHHVRL
jgi:hypothetical protein